MRKGIVILITDIILFCLLVLVLVNPREGENRISYYNQWFYGLVLSLVLLTDYTMWLNRHYQKKYVGKIARPFHLEDGGTYYTVSVSEDGKTAIVRNFKKTGFFGNNGVKLGEPFRLSLEARGLNRTNGTWLLRECDIFKIIKKEGKVIPKRISFESTGLEKEHFELEVS